MSSGNFSNELKVLVYAEEHHYLHYYVEHLTKIQFKVTSSSDEQEVTFLLSERKYMFDIALLDVKKPEGCIFQLISNIDLPIIIISEDNSVASVTKWMTNGACDFLLKPPRPDDLELIYKNVVRASKNSLVVTGEKVSGEAESSDRACASSSKKRRIMWDGYLRNKFCDAINYLGDKAVPKSILEHMKVPYLTRDHVASHLQKYRQNEEKKKKESTTPEERQEGNHDEKVFIAIPDDNSGMANPQPGNQQQNTIINTTQPRSDTCIIGQETEWIYNRQFYGLDSLFHTNLN